MTAMDNSTAIRSVVYVHPPGLPTKDGAWFADCLWARLETQFRNDSVSMVIISLSLGTAEISPGFPLCGRIRVGLQRVKLRLNAHGGEIPNDDRWPSHAAEIGIIVEKTERRLRSRNESSKATAKANIGLAIETETMAEVSNNGANEESSEEKYTLHRSMVRSGGSEQRPYWEFSCVGRREVLSCEVSNQTVGNFLIMDSDPYITYGFEFMDSDVRIMATEGILIGRGGSDQAPTRPVVLAIIRKAVAADLRRAVEMPALVP